MISQRKWNPTFAHPVWVAVLDDALVKRMNALSLHLHVQIVWLDGKSGMSGRVNALEGLFPPRGIADGWDHFAGCSGCGREYFPRVLNGAWSCERTFRRALVASILNLGVHFLVQCLERVKFCVVRTELDVHITNLNTDDKILAEKQSKCKVPTQKRCLKKLVDSWINW